MAWPDIVALLIAHLDTLTAEHVGSRVPSPRPDICVQVRRVGGPKEAPVRDRPRVDLIVRAPTESAAMTLLLTLRASITAMQGTTTLGPQVYRVEETMGPRQDDDPLTGTPMAWMTFSILIRADEAIR